ncbi:MAG: hypothetical protein ACYDBQ_11105 [Thermoplasmatota archaeon]
MAQPPAAAQPMGRAARFLVAFTVAFLALGWAAFRTTPMQAPSSLLLVAVGAASALLGLLAAWAAKPV